MNRPAGTVRTLVRGLSKRCPRCGLGLLFDGWNHLRPRCTECGLSYERRAGDTWFFMYMTTAGLTGLVVVAMLLVRPTNLLRAQLVLAPIVLLLIGGTLPYRKGLAIAMDYLVEQRLGDDSEGES